MMKYPVEYHCCEIEAHAPQFNYHYTGQKVVLKNWYYAKSETLLTQAPMSLQLRDQPYLKGSSQSCLVISNL